MSESIRHYSLDKKTPEKKSSSLGNKKVKIASVVKKIKLPKVKKSTQKTIYVILIIIMFTVTLLSWRGIVSGGVNALVDSYNATYLSEYDTTYNQWYERYYQEAESKYHVRNEVAISIGDIREVGLLEVLNVSDIEFIIQNKDRSNGNLVSWMEVPGEGTFVVNLQAAEFIIDNERRHVLVRVPEPELTNVQIIYAKVDKVLFKDDMFNGSYRQGEELARRQLSEADLLIKKEFAMNQHYYLSAQNAARSSIECLVYKMNPGISDLTVEVEFY